jgi:hypothetical protein
MIHHRPPPAGQPGRQQAAGLRHTRAQGPVPSALPQQVPSAAPRLQQQHVMLDRIHASPRMAVQRQRMAMAVVQRFNENQPWSVAKAKYQANKVGNKRLDGDAEWLAIKRYCARVQKLPDDTVSDVLAKAKAGATGKRIAFSEWKGAKLTGDLQEAQHLVSSSYATNTLKWPYDWVNSKHNGKMLLSGRGEFFAAPEKYAEKKGNEGKGVNRGLLHITNGVAHNTYDQKLDQYIRNYYAAHHLVMGAKIDKIHFFAITAHLRDKHKALDGQANPHHLGVDDLTL